MVCLPAGFPPQEGSPAFFGQGSSSVPAGDGMRGLAGAGRDMLASGNPMPTAGGTMKTKPTHQSPKRKSIRKMQSLTIGMDLGDKTSRFCAIDSAGDVVNEGGVATTRKAISEKFTGVKGCRIAIEVGTHSPWVSRLLLELGHEVIVANPRQLKAITESSRKSDKVDAETLARLARVDPTAATSGSSPQRTRSNGPDGHPGASGAGPGANLACQYGARTRESHWRAHSQS